MNFIYWTQAVPAGEDLYNVLSAAGLNIKMASQSANNCIPGNSFVGFYMMSDAEGLPSGQTEGFIIALRWYSGPWVTQLYINDNNLKLYMRARQTATTWKDWKEL